MRKLEDLTLTTRDRAAIEDAVKVLKSVAPVETVILFGSKCRGDYDAESDIDLLVLTSRPLSRNERHGITDALFPVQLRHEVVLSPVVVSRSEWDTGLVSVLPIHNAVEEQGALAA
jgi:predicted nucleotidyltransferase